MRHYYIPRRYAVGEIYFSGHDLDCEIHMHESLACCADHSVRAIDDVIFSARKTLLFYTDEEYNRMVYGFRKSLDRFSDFRKLSVYVGLLEKHRQQLLKGSKVCLKCEELQKVLEKVKILSVRTEVNCRNDLIIDESNKADWNLSNPYCVSREKWEKLLYRVCNDMGLNLKVVSLKNLCDITYNVRTSTIDCTVLAALSYYKVACNLDHQIKVSQTDCSLEHNLLKKKYNCDLSLKVYNKLIDCNISPTVIKTVYDCGMSLDVEVREKEICPILITLTGTRLNVCDLNFDSKLTKKECELIASISKNPGQCNLIDGLYDQLDTEYVHFLK